MSWHDRLRALMNKVDYSLSPLPLWSTLKVGAEKLNLLPH